MKIVVIKIKTEHWRILRNKFTRKSTTRHCCKNRRHIRQINFIRYCEYINERCSCTHTHTHKYTHVNVYTYNEYMFLTRFTPTTNVYRKINFCQRRLPRTQMLPCRTDRRHRKKPIRCSFFSQSLFKRENYVPIVAITLIPFRKRSQCSVLQCV